MLRCFSQLSWKSMFLTQTPAEFVTFSNIYRLV